MQNSDSSEASSSKSSTPDAEYDDKHQHPATTEHPSTSHPSTSHQPAPLEDKELKSSLSLSSDIAESSDLSSSTAKSRRKYPWSDAEPAELQSHHPQLGELSTRLNQLYQVEKVLMEPMLAQAVHRANEQGKSLASEYPIKYVHFTSFDQSTSFNQIHEDAGLDSSAHLTLEGSSVTGDSPTNSETTTLDVDPSLATSADNSTDSPADSLADFPKDASSQASSSLADSSEQTSTSQGNSFSASEVGLAQSSGQVSSEGLGQVSSEDLGQALGQDSAQASAQISSQTTEGSSDQSPTSPVVSTTLRPFKKLTKEQVEARLLAKAAQGRKSDSNAKSKSIYDVLTPHQVEMQKKVPSAGFMVILLSLLSVTPGLANTSFNPAIVEVAKEYHTTTAVIQALTSPYLLGLGIGQLFWGPITDRFGRRKVLIAGAILSVIINFVFINSITVFQLQLARFFQGVAFSCFGLLPTAILRDTYSARNFVVYNSWVTILFLLAPAFAPIMGGFVLISLGWKWIFNIISLIAVVATILYLIRIPETLDPLKKISINPKKLAQNYKQVFTNPKSILCLSIGGWMALVTFAWTALCSAILIEDWNIPPQNIGYYSFLPVIFTIIANRLNGIFVQKYSPQKISIWATSFQFGLSFINLVVAYWFLGPWGIVFCQTINVLWAGFQNANVITTYLLDYQHMIGTASSLYLSLRTIIPALVILVVAHLDRHQGATFLIFNFVVILVNFILIFTLNARYPAPADKFARLSKKALKRLRKHRTAAFNLH